MVTETVDQMDPLREIWMKGKIQGNKCGWIQTCFHIYSIIDIIHLLSHLPVLRQVRQAEGDGGAQDEERVKDSKHCQNFSECHLKLKTESTWVLVLLVPNELQGVLKKHSIVSNDDI
jgi:hypothetical protein